MLELTPERRSRKLRHRINRGIGEGTFSGGLDCRHLVEVFVRQVTGDDEALGRTIKLPNLPTSDLSAAGPPSAKGQMA